MSREFLPRATYLAAVLQGILAVWLLLEPGGFPLAVLAILVAGLTLWLARQRQRRPLAVMAVALVVIGGLFVFSGGLIVAANGGLLLLGLATDWLIASLPPRALRSP